MSGGRRLLLTCASSKDYGAHVLAWQVSALGVARLP